MAAVCGPHPIPACMFGRQAGRHVRRQGGKEARRQGSRQAGRTTRTICLSLRCVGVVYRERRHTRKDDAANDTVAVVACKTWGRRLGLDWLGGFGISLHRPNMVEPMATFLLFSLQVVARI